MDGRVSVYNVTYSPINHDEDLIHQEFLLADALEQSTEATLSNLTAGETYIIRVFSVAKAEPIDGSIEISRNSSDSECTAG